MGENMKKSKIILLLSAMLLIVSLFAVGCGGPKTFKVTFDANGGTLVSGELVQDVENATAIQAPVVEKTGYTLSWDTDLSTITEETTVKAVWTANTYTVTFNLNDSANAPAVMEGESTKQYVYDATMDIPTPTRVGYIFAGWRKGGAEGELLVQGAKNNIAEDYTAYAMWTADDGQTFAISYDLAGGNMKAGEENPAVYSAASATITLKAPVKTGYRFLGWKEGEAEPVKNVTIEAGSVGARSFVATWEQITYIVKFVLSGVDNNGKPGTLTIDGQSMVDDITVLGGETLGDKLPVEFDAPAGDYVFSYWKTEIAGNEIKVDGSTVFTGEVFGEQDATITLTVMLTSNWSGRH